MSKNFSMVLNSKWWWDIQELFTSCKQTLSRVCKNMYLKFGIY